MGAVGAFDAVSTKKAGVKKPDGMARAPQRGPAWERLEGAPPYDGFAA